MGTLAWIHLSDWHQEGPAPDRQAAYEALLCDVRERAQISPDLARIDLVILSGDLAYRGLAKEYALAGKQFLSPLLEVAGVPPQRLFLVPGNHDLENARLQVRARDLAQEFSASPRTAAEWLADGNRRQQLLAPFDSYSRFASAYLGTAEPAPGQGSAYAAVARHDIDGRQVAVLGLNSALLGGSGENEWVADADVYAGYEAGLIQLLELIGRDHPRYGEALVYQQRLQENIDLSRRYGDTETRRAGRAEIVDKLNGLAVAAAGKSLHELGGLAPVAYAGDLASRGFVGEAQVQAALERAGSADLYVAVMHHPLDRLMEFDRNRIQDLLCRKCHLVLHGHHHLGSVQAWRATAGDCLVVPAGASYPRPPAGLASFAVAYNLVHLNFDLGQGTIYLRRYHGREGWGPDTATTGEETPGFHEFPLPKGGRDVPRAKRDALGSRGYRVKRLLARGGMSVVWLAEQQGREVAIKELRPLAAANEQTILKWEEQFKNEFRILSGLEHPSIPRLVDFFTHGSAYYLVMGYVDGVTLEERSKRLPVDEERVLGWAGQLCSVLKYLHGHSPPVIFRDLNPSNVMLARDGKVMLIDFGIAKSFRDDRYRYATQTVLKLGTEGYMPPEQNNTAVYEEEGEAGTDERSDVYSLGATLYYLLTKTVPRDSIRRAIDYRRFGEDQLPSLRELNPHVSRYTDEVIQVALQLCKEDRYPSVAEFEQALFTPDGPVESITHPKDGAEMILVPGGCFWMGANDVGADERPRRKVWVEPFYIDKHPVTYGQYKRFVEETGYRRPPHSGDSAYYSEEWSHYYQPGREGYPVVNVTWQDAQAYATWAGKELPTEEQWEKAARGRNGIRYPWGNRWDSNRCNSFLLADPQRIGQMIPMWNGERGTLPVGLFPEGESPYGVQDMAGNVLEWTRSDYPLSGAKVVRGGSWYRDAPDYFRCSKRYWYFLIYSVNWLGMRCVASPETVRRP